MKHLMNAMTQYFEGVPDQLRKRRILVWLFFFAATVFFAFGITRVKFETSIEGWFDKDDATIVAFDWFHHEFGSDDHLYLVYKPVDGNVFSEKSLKTLQQLQQDLQGRVSRLQKGDPSALQHIVKITSLINAPILTAEDGALVSRKLVGAGVPGPQDIDKIRQIAESQKSFPLLYFSKDYKYGGMVIETNFGAIPVVSTANGKAAAAVAKDALEITDLDLKLEEPAVASGAQERPKFKPTEMTDYIALMNEVKIVLNKPEYAAHFEFHPVGSTATAEYNLQMVNEMGMLNAAALIIIMVLLALLFRSLSAVVWPVVIVILCSIWTIGITAWIGWPISAFVMVTIMLTLAIGVADTVHVMSTYLTLRNEGHDHQSALRRGFRNVVVACLLTTLTNIVAVIALSITPIIPIQVFAFMCVLGVGLPFIFSVYLFPLMLDLWAPKPSANTGEGFSPLLGRTLKKVLPVVEKRPVTFIALFMALFVACIYGSFQTKVDTDPVRSFPETAKIRQSVDIVDKNMMGAQSMEIYLDLGKENAFHDPFVLNAIDKLQQTIEGNHKELVVRTTSLVDTIKYSYKTLNDNREDKYVVPDTQSAVSQTLFLFNQSNPTDRMKLVSDNYDKSHISVRLYSRGSYEYTKTWDAIRADIDKSVAEIRKQYPDAKVSITGILPLLMQGSDYLTNNQLQSFAAAVALVSAVLLVLFGSTKAGAIALIPNLIPALLAYGVLGLLDRSLDITTMMIAPIIIGIAVDDTVHFITHYRDEVVVHGDIRKALEMTITKTGQSIVFTSIVLGLGFGVMGFASNAGVANLGIFGSLAIIVGLLNDLFLLPALILVFKLKFPVNQPSLVKPELSSASLHS